MGGPTLRAISVGDVTRPKDVTGGNRVSRYVNVAMLQIASTSTEPDFQARKLEHWGKMAYYLDAMCTLNPNIDVVVAPEIYIDGMDPLHFHELAETIPGPMTDLFCAKAAQLGIWLVPGSMLEKMPGEDGFYNTAPLISPKGEIVMKYRKIFIPRPMEPSKPGREFPVYEAEGIGKIALMICADAHVPEVSRNLALNGAELILKPALQPHWIGNVRNLVPVVQTRAIENQCFVVSVNHPAPLAMGHSCICDPEGRIVEELGETDSYVVATLNLDDVTTARRKGFVGCFPLLQMVKQFKQEGVPLDKCYLGDLCVAPLFKELEGNVPTTPEEFLEQGHQTL